jgi:uncharacterized protein (TIGR02145 family)
MKISFVIALTTLFITIPGCKKDNPLSIQTLPVSNIDVATATSGGNIISDGGSLVIDCGILWGTSENPSLPTNNKTSDGQGVGWFPLEIIKLQPKTKYFVRAYIVNSIDTAYGNNISFTTLDGILDADGNGYRTLIIGTQTWLSKNLATTKLNDGTDIPLVTDGNNQWRNLTTPACCWLNNDDIHNKEIYGALYNWFTVASGKLCPQGWHVPTDGDWTTLVNFLGGENIAGGKLKETGTDHWQYPNTNATNEVDFTARPGGFRAYGGTFFSWEFTGFWWSSTGNGTDFALLRQITNDATIIERKSDFKQTGFSVRCTKN